MAPFLNELRDLVKYIVRKNDLHVTIQILQQEEFEKGEIVIDNINQKGKGWTAFNQTEWDSGSSNLSTPLSDSVTFM